MGDCHEHDIAITEDETNRGPSYMRHRVNHSMLEFHVAGTSFRKDSVVRAHDYYLRFRAEGQIMDALLIPEPENKYDKNAIRVMASPKVSVYIFVGYVPKDRTKEVCNWRIRHTDHTIKVRYIGDNGTRTGNLGVIIELKEVR